MADQWPPGAAWHPDPVGRHDLRFWSGASWADRVSDLGVQTDDPIEPLTVESVTIRPSASALWSKVREVPAWRLALIPVALAFAAALGYFADQALLVEVLGAFGLICLVVLPPVYFKVFYIRADQNGVEIRNQVGLRRFVPRERIGMVTVGKAWDAGLSRPEFAFILSPSGERLGRFFLQNWQPEDFARLASALGLHLYGRPGRVLDELHSGCAIKHGVRLLGGSLALGAILGCAFPIVFVIAIAVAVAMARMSGH